MKKWIYPILFFTGLFITSCVDEIDDVFDTPATQRMDATLKNIRDILISAPSGWQLNYFPDPETYGGYTLLMSFKADGTVEVAAEKELFLAGLTDHQDQRTTSLYQLKSDTGPTLSFDTYNSIFHIFSDPDPDGIGMGGDYEFVVLNATNEQIELSGKKGEAKLTLRRLADTENWDHYLYVIDSVASVAVSTGFEMTINGKQFSAATASGLGRNLILTDGNGDEAAQIAYSYTPTGICLYEPLPWDGKQIQHFDYIAEQDLLKCTDEGSNATINLILTPINEYFLNSPNDWYFNSKLMSPALLDYWKSGVTKLKQTTGEKIYSFRMGYQANNDGWFFTIACLADGTSGNTGILSFIPSLIENTNDQLMLEFEGRANQPGWDYYLEYGINIIIGELSSPTGFTYVLTPDNPRLPRKLTFTKIDSPDLWFTLSTQSVTWP